MQFTGYHLGVKFQFPTALPTFWTFASVPNSTASGIHISPTLYFAPVYIIVTSILVAGFVGSIGEFIETERYDFSANARNYFLPFLGYTVLRWAVIVLPVTLGLFFGPIVLVMLLVVLVLEFVFYGTPFLIVVDDCSLSDALGRSYELATGDSNYVTFGIGYFVFVVIASLIGTIFINFGIIGVVIGAVCTAPIALALTAASVEFFIDLRSPGTHLGERPPDERPPTERSSDERFDY